MYLLLNLLNIVYNNLLHLSINFFTYFIKIYLFRTNCRILLTYVLNSAEQFVFHHFIEINIHFSQSFVLYKACIGGAQKIQTLYEVRIFSVRATWKRYFRHFGGGIRTIEIVFILIDIIALPRIPFQARRWNPPWFYPWILRSHIAGFFGWSHCRRSAGGFSYHQGW